MKSCDYDDEDKEPRFQFRGGYMHPIVLYTGLDKDITKTDVFLLMFVGSMVSAGGKGCWASNRYLSKLLKCSQTHVSKSISRLKKAKLLRVYYVDDVRYLEPTDARHPEERTPWSKKTNPPSSTRKPLSKTPYPPCRKRHTPLVENANQYNTLGKDTLEKESRVGGADHATTSFLLDSSDEVTIHSKPSITKFDIEIATKLWNFIASKGYKNPKSAINKWADEIRLLRKSSKRALIRKVMDWYINQYYDGCENPKFRIQVHSTKAFREKYPKLLIVYQSTDPEDDDGYIHKNGKRYVRDEFGLRDVDEEERIAREFPCG